MKKCVFLDDNFTSRMKCAKEYIDIHNPGRMDKYLVMKRAVTGSKLYKVSSGNRQNKMDQLFLSVLLKSKGI